MEKRIARIDQQYLSQMEHSGRSLDIVFDSVQTTLGVRVYRTGKKSFVQRTSSNGRSQIRVIGPTEAMTIDEARLVAKQTETDSLQHKHKHQHTFKDAANLWIELHAARHRKSCYRDDFPRLKRHIFPAIGDKRLASITAIDLIRLHARISDLGATEANRVIALIRTVFNYAKRLNLYDGPNPTSAVTLNRESCRTRWVSREEMPRLLASIRKEQNVFIRSFFLLLLLTGLRKNELLKLKWENVDLSSHTLTIPSTKNGKAFTQLLSPEAVGILAAIPRTDQSTWVFQGARKNTHVSNLRLVWPKILERANISELTIHDLRRTFASWMSISGESIQTISRSLNHSRIQTTQIYAYIDDSVQMNAIKNVSHNILNCAGQNGCIPAAYSMRGNNSQTFDNSTP